MGGLGVGNHQGETPPRRPSPPPSSLLGGHVSPPFLTQLPGAVFLPLLPGKFPICGVPEVLSSVYPITLRLHKPPDTFTGPHKSPR